MQSTDLEEFDPESITFPCRNLLIGKTGVGKSVFLKWLLYHNEDKIDSVMIFASTIWNGQYNNVTSYLYEEFDHKLVENIIKKRKEKIKNNEKVGNLLIILDDFIDNPSLSMGGRGDPILTQLFSYGRHLFISVWILSQKLTKVSPTLRVNSEYIFLFSLPNRKEMEAAEEEFNPYEKHWFEKVMTEYSHSYQVICVNNSKYSLEFSVGKADEIPPDYKFKRFFKTIPDVKKEKPKKDPEEEQKNEPLSTKKAIKTIIETDLLKDPNMMIAHQEKRRPKFSRKLLQIR